MLLLLFQNSCPDILLNNPRVPIRKEGSKYKRGRKISKKILDEKNILNRIRNH